MSAFKEISMRAKQLVVFTAICFAFCWLTLGKAQTPQQKAPARVYNTAKQKLKDGKQIVSATVFSPDPHMYCAIANVGHDFMWTEMQAMPLSLEYAAIIIFGCQRSSAMVVL